MATAASSFGETSAVMLSRSQNSASVGRIPIKSFGSSSSTKPLKQTETQKSFNAALASRNVKGSGNPNINRGQALNQAKDSAGIPRSQQSTRQWTTGDDITKKGGNYKNYEYSENATYQGRYYEYDTPQGKKVIVDHTNDVEQGLHTHAGKVPNGANPLTYNFKNPDNRYKPINKDTDHHIRYTNK
ncbi:HNH/endonuclease VII fold putative polymorphic toxin [Clostridium frigidicarnis]|uniref:HNH/Endo VII superfamily nuclease toxins n=1 Tax=Clostridium frigidicarnis TaxID=84698 RepID=A0A1I1AJD4_9CLOT|nr:HNH/endonuclease VII fold putative polymorphic toxin [Clostridium frigidicarnis]SFB38124.1 HNH/Endo VII superfamily nuclease toxins [Clostridium frigidicarnis]